MTTLDHKDKDATKVIVTACKLVDQRKATKGAPEDQKAREVGRLKKAGYALDDAVAQYRANGGQP